MYRRHRHALAQGGVCLDAEHVQRMGDVAGRKLIHLQCHMGMETLSWARLGAEVTGIDFSEPAIERARQVSTELCLPARFICANVYAARDVVQGAFDIVFVSVGSICWLPDIDRWAAVVAGLLSAQGKLYMDEVHPFADVLEDDPTQTALVVRQPYFQKEGQLWHEAGSYAASGRVFEHTAHRLWTHPIGSVVNALIGAGLRIGDLFESPRCEWRRFGQMIETEPNRYALPGPLAGKLPMSYTVIASKDSGMHAVCRP